jgi:hypothetical protein
MKKVASLQPANEGEKRRGKRGKANRKIKKNKVCELKKGFYLCSPKTRG